MYRPLSLLRVGLFTFMWIASLIPLSNQRGSLSKIFTSSRSMWWPGDSMSMIIRDFGAGGTGSFMFKKSGLWGAFCFTNVEFFAFASGGLALTINSINWPSNVFLISFVFGGDKDSHSIQMWKIPSKRSYFFKLLVDHFWLWPSILPQIFVMRPQFLIILVLVNTYL